MSFTLPTAYSNATKQGNIQENWIVQLGYDEAFDSSGTSNKLNEALDDSETGVDVDSGSAFATGDYIKIDSEIMYVSSVSSNTLTVLRGQQGTAAAEHDNDTQIYFNNFIPLALADTTIDDVFYHGVITTNTPSIRYSLDLADSKAKTGNVSLNIVNFNYKGDDLSAELFLGTRKYINRNVKIYSQLNNASALSDCFQVYNGRLIDISHDDSSIKLTFTEQRPWDFITIPLASDKTTISRVPVPVSYGAFTASANSFYDSTVSSHDLTDTKFDHEITNTDLRPCPLNNATDNHIFFVADTAAKSDSRAEHWDSGLQKFLPINNSDDDAITTSVANDGQYCTKSELELKRAIKLRPNTVAVSANTDSITNSNNANMIDADADWVTSKATIGPNTVASGSGESIDFEFTDMKYPSGEFVRGAIWITSELASVGGTGGAIRIEVSVDGTTFSNLYSYSSSSGSSRAKATEAFTISSFPSTFKVKVRFLPVSGSISGTAYIYNVMLAAEMKTRDDQTKMVYIGADGNTESWSGSSGAIEYGHEAHRDMLIRFTGYTTTTPENWSALNTDRSLATWKIRWWELDSVAVKDILEQLQYEFGFIFKFRPDGTGSYIHIKQTSELSATQTLTKGDIDNIKISNSPFSELQTKMEINYETHPAEKRYLSSVTSDNSTARTNWNIQAKENISEVNLDMNVGTPNTSGQSDPNADFYSYYDNIFGDIKKIVTCDIVNPAVGYNLETGDIIQFSNTAGEMPVEPFGDNWADYYMITDLQRSPGRVKIQAREVG